MYTSCQSGCEGRVSGGKSTIQALLHFLDYGGRSFGRNFSRTAPPPHFEHSARTTAFVTNLNSMRHPILEREALVGGIPWQLYLLVVDKTMEGHLHLWHIWPQIRQEGALA